jgi:hypothetical protein
LAGSGGKAVQRKNWKKFWIILVYKFIVWD